MSATTAYATQQARAAEQVAELQSIIDNLPAPDDDDSHRIDWGHVGSLEHVNTELFNLLAFLNSSPD
jgi:hypothetical protein